jgi:O-antigen ligase
MSRLTNLGALRGQGLGELAAAAALCAVPLSIALSEICLTVALASQLFQIVRRQKTIHVPRIFWYWLVWAGLEAVAWLRSPQLAAGLGEMRHLLLIAGLFLILPSVSRPTAAVTVWRWILVAATVGSSSVIAAFLARLVRYRHELAGGGDPAFYLRSGGLLHHWMVYAIVEVLVFAALLELRWTDGGNRRWLTAASAINGLAILLTLTRSLWLACLVILAIHLASRRSKWLWAVPLLPVAIFLLIPGPIHNRLTQSSQPEYYSNAERVQMLRVGWRMIRQHPLFGVGPGRVEELYARFLRPGETLPAYHGHLHNNAVQLGAQFGCFVLAGALVFLAVLIRDLLRAYTKARTPEQKFLCRCGLGGLAGFLTIGLMDYTYGHSLGLILVAFAIFAPLMQTDEPAARAPRVRLRQGGAADQFQ